MKVAPLTFWRTLANIRLIISSLPIFNFWPIFIVSIQCFRNPYRHILKIKLFLLALVIQYLQNVTHCMNSKVRETNFTFCFCFFILSIIKTLSERIWTSELYGMNLTQFYINFLRQEHQIELSWVSINSCAVRLRKTIST